MQVTNQPVDPATRDAQTRTVEQHRAGGVQATGGQDQLLISAQAMDIQSIMRGIESLPDVRAEKVQTLRKRIEDGSYDVSAMEIAERALLRILGGRVV